MMKSTMVSYPIPWLGGDLREGGGAGEGGGWNWDRGHQMKSEKTRVLCSRRPKKMHKFRV